MARGPWVAHPCSKQIKSRRLIYTTENNLKLLEHHMTQKTPLINYVISNNKNKEETFEKEQESLEYAGKPGHVDSHCDVKKACELQIYL